MFILSVLYEIEPLEIIFMERVKQSLNTTTALDCLNMFKSIVISDTFFKDSKHKSDQSMKRLIGKYDFIMDFVSKNINKYSVQQLVDIDAVLYSKIISKLDIIDLDKISYIEYFMESNAVNSPIYDFFINLIDWNNNESYKYLTKYRCDWLSNELSYKLTSKIINNRIKSITRLSKKLSDMESNMVSGLGLLSYIVVISDADENNNEPVVELVNFIGTVGGICRFFNPCRFGFFTLISSKAVSELYYSALYVLEESDRYFMSKYNVDNLSYIGLNLGDNIIKISSMFIDYLNTKKSIESKFYSAAQKNSQTNFMSLELYNNEGNKYMFPKYLEIGKKFTISESERPSTNLFIVKPLPNSEVEVGYKYFRITVLKVWCSLTLV